MTRLAALLSGGKDSVYAVYLAQQFGWDVACSVVMAPKRDDSYMFHVPNIALAPLVSEAMGIRARVFETSGEKERELEDLKGALASLEVDGVLTGAIASDYQWSRTNRVCDELGLQAFSPLWRKSQERVLREEVAAGFEIIFTGLFSEGLGKELLGKRIDESVLHQLSAISGLNVAGEGGEYETLVVDGPNFGKRLEINEREVKWDGISGTLEMGRAALTGKNRRPQPPRTRSA